MSAPTVTSTIRYIGVDDKTIDLFESQYPVPNGVSYNSYAILDQKLAILDTVDPRGTEQWLKNLEQTLAGRQPDYLVVSHMEPDHAGNIQRLCEMYPNLQVVGNAKTFTMIGQFFTLDLPDSRKVLVGEGDTLSLGAHTLQFFMAPMVHWPEVMVTYEQSEKVLFSADGFGKFGTLDTQEDWACEARRYYFNIVGKYGGPVQQLLKKAAALDIEIICPLHGPVLRENLGYYIGLYDTWSRYQPEDEGVLLAHASIHGHTAKAAEKMAEILRQKGAEVVLCDLNRTDVSEAVEDAFRYSKMLLAAASYDAGLFPSMEAFLHHLKAKTYQNRAVALMENGSWAPSAGKCMKALLGEMKNIDLCEQMVSIRSAMKETDLPAMEALADELLQK
ncbi:FprA family A-type flavoprotein [Neobittarella massiliensis]|uniref:FprA family A-type flavoprotein n=2 Tax=Oscillospiraceae TaxID=216572 RepID=A0A8J6IP42_9FIRM|nr:FprA family A-type flavoprotein [Neobittarella massiliensis]MBC3517239.1 FprA family A-type flavoprotein [Neobittarella massiliensis]SCJ74213.1 H(2)O-forming NADH oxidase [uncultured Anaerotruncus sp.]